MADSNIAISAGSGTLIDTRTVSGDHRQVIVIGDETAATIAAVTSAGLAVNVTTLPKATTGTITSPSVGTTTGVVLASNLSRKSATVYVESGSTAYLALAATASLTAYTVQLAAGDLYEIPGYTGAVSGITASGSTVVRVTELT